MPIQNPKKIPQGIDLAGGKIINQSISLEAEITVDTIFDGSQKGINEIYRVNSPTPRTITIQVGDYVENDIINIERTGQGSVEIIADTGVFISGVRNIENRYFINDPNSLVALICKGSEKFTIVGNLTRGYIGAVTTTSYSDLQEGATGANVTVIGSGFSENMVITVSANAVLNSFTYVNNSQITLNIDAVGLEGATVTVTYFNGDTFVDTDAITIASAGGSIPIGNLTSYYKFNSNGIDDVGSNTATLGAGAGYVAGLINNALDVTGNETSYAILPDSPALSFPNTAFSVTFLVRFDALIDSVLAVKRSNTSTSNQEYYFGINSSGEVVARLYSVDTSNSKGGTTSGAGILANTWHVITISDDGTNNFSGLKVSVNGVNQTITDNSLGTYTGMTDSTMDVKIGALFSDTEAFANFMNGKFNAVAFWNIELSDAQKTDISSTLLSATHLI